MIKWKIYESKIQKVNQFKKRKYTDIIIFDNKISIKYVFIKIIQTNKHNPPEQRSSKSFGLAPQHMVISDPLGNDFIAG